MDPDSISIPPLHLCVEKFDKNTTPGNLWKLLLSNNVEADDLHILKNKKKEPYAAIVKFSDAESASNAVGSLNKKKDQSGNEIAVSPFVHLEYSIGEKSDDYKKFVGKLRKLFTHRKDGIPPEYIKEEKDGKNSGTVLGEQLGGNQPVRWIHIKLIANKGDAQESTTLVIRDDNLYVKGFTGMGGRWFELCEDREPDGEKLPLEYYNAMKLKGWGCKYDNLMNLNDSDQVKATLKSMELGKAFAERAVRRLSRYCPEDVEKNKDDDIPVRLGLAGLFVMISEAARFNLILQHIAGADCWKNGKGLEPKLVDGVEVDLVELIWRWKSMSAALLKWRDSKGSEWKEECGAKSADDALKYVHLVLKPKDTELGDRYKAHVEILQVSVNFHVGDIHVIDEKKNQQKIYDAKEQGPSVIDRQANKDPLEVIARNGISGYAWFGIQVNGSPKMRWDWDCRKDDGDAPYQLVTRDIPLGASDDRIRFTYLVMSNPVQATVAIKLQLPVGDSESLKCEDGYTASGTISAYISDLEQEHPILLFRRSEAIKFDPIEFHSSSLPLPLDRSAAVQVPHGKQLQIDLSKLHIQGPDGERLEIDPGRLYTEGQHVSSSGAVVNNRIRFDIKNSGATIIPLDGGRALEVKVTWKVKQNKRIELHAVCEDIADKKMFTDCIDALRKEMGKGCQDVLEGYNGQEDYPMDSHPVLKSQPQRWIHVKLQTVMADGTSATKERSSEVGVPTRPHASVTLAITDDTCCGVGFQNRSGVWYDLGTNFWWEKALPAEYNSVLQHWRRIPEDWGRGVSYKDILGVRDWGEVKQKLDNEWPGKQVPGKKGLGRDFAKEAVCILCRYPDVEEGENPRLALAGIMLMVCESTRLNTLYDYFQATWDSGPSLSFSEQEGWMNHIRKWGQISRALLYWRDNGYTKSDDNKWLINLQTKKTGTTSSVLKSLSGPQDALDIVHLVFNYWPRQIDMEPYTIRSDSTTAAQFTAFIQKLRSKLADHEHWREHDDVLDGHRPVVVGRRHGWPPARLFHVKLQLAADGKTSTTLAVRDDTVSVAGFKNQHGTWYDLVGDAGTLPREYEPRFCLWWGPSYGTMLKLFGGSQQKDAVERLDTAGLSREFATKAVDTLSRFRREDSDREEEARLALVGLSLMVCESARFNTLLRHFDRVWDSGTRARFPPALKALLGYEHIWFDISDALLRWKKDGHWSPQVDHRDLKEMGIEGEEDARDAVALMYNF